MVCTICGKEFEAERTTAKYCSGSCRIKAMRNANVTLNNKDVTVTDDSVTKPEVSVTNDVTVTPDNGTDNAPKHRPETNKWDLNLNPEKDPLKRITEIPNSTADMDYYHSQTYKNLIEELESKSIKQLEKEKYFIPAWKISGYKKRPDLSELLK